MSHPFSDPLIRDWLFGSFKILGNYSPILTIGFLPFTQNDIDDFLRKRDFLVFNLSLRPRLTSDTVIIGQTGWSEYELGNLISERTGQTLKIYSQEMFLSYIMTGNDPFDGSRELLYRFAEGHPALEYLLELGFDWPSTFVFGGGGETEIDETNWPKIGLLRHMKYKVGNNGIKNAKRRQKILETVYTSTNLPLVNSRSYMAEWGEARSCTRLQKMANSLATFCRNAKWRSNPPKLAVEHWEMDLDWIFKRFYQGRCSFMWPSTYVE